MTTSGGSDILPRSKGLFMPQEYLKPFIHTHNEPITAVLLELFAQKKQSATALSPIQVHSIEVLQDFVLQGGKRIRPMLVLLGYLLADGEITSENHPIYRVASTIELVHKYLLLLDDIADQDEMRNSQPTIWKRYQNEFTQDKWSNSAHHGRTFAEIDGALLASLVTEQLLSIRGPEFSAEQILEVLHLIDKHQYFETVAGWQIQYKLNHVALSEATEAEFMKGLELVTARYTFVGPLNIGLSLGKPSKELKKSLEVYGTAVGKAFQIQDDILGLFGDPEETGKPVGNDVREGKKTLLLQKAFQLSNAGEKKFLSDVCGRELNDEELKRVQNIVKESGSLAYSQKLAQDFIDEGIAALSTLDQNKNEVKVLTELAKFVLKRNV